MDWLVGMLRRRHPREGWLLWLLGLAAVLLMGLAANSAPELKRLSQALATVALLGYMAGFAATRLARARAESRLPGILAALGLGLLGAAVAALAVGWDEAALDPAAAHGVAAPLAHARLAVADVAERMGQWLVAVLAQRRSPADDAVWRAGLVFVGWSAAAWAGWHLFTRGRTLLALWPTGVLLALAAYLSWEARLWLPVFLALSVVLAVWVQRWQLEQRWQRRGMDFSPHLQLEILSTAGILAFLVGVAALWMPHAPFQPTARWFDRVAAAPVQRLESQARVWFPGLPRFASPGLVAGGAGGGMPRSQLLGMGPALGRELVMTVRSDATAGLRWRGWTYDRYDGAGWSNSRLSARELPAGEPWIAATVPDRGRAAALRQSIVAEQGGDQAVYAAGDPVAVNRRSRALARSDDDLAALVVSTRRYDVVSTLPAADAAALRSAGRAYPEAIASRYLALPAALPTRVRDLARRIAARSSTPYDQALALERALRGLRYDLSVAPPPPDRDAVDYFLFDSRTGYCDYFASAMVVLARSLGIPARLAVGYATGSYNAQDAAWQVRASDAHSWPELYFPEIGWVGFEPTPSQPLALAQARMDAPSPGAPPTPVAPAGALQDQLASLGQGAEAQQRAAALRVGLALGALVAAVAVGWRMRRRWDEADLAALYGQLAQAGAHLGARAAPADSARAYGVKLSTALRSRWPVRARDVAAAEQVQDFVAQFERAQYGPRPDEAALGEQAARAAWPRLRRSLRVIRLGWRAGGSSGRYRAN